MKKKVVLAFSGGLDTSYCAKYLTDDLAYDVLAVTVNTGGFTDKEAQQLKVTARELGVASYDFLDRTKTFYEGGIRHLIFGNVLKNNTYPLSVSAERVFQAMAIAEYAARHDANAIAHGSTGAGNDQIRFDLVFHALCPDAEIITPIRDQSLSREEEIEYLKSKGVQRDWTQSAYSINQGLWGTSVGGKETLTSDQFLPEEAFLSKLRQSESRELSISFEKGEPVGLDGVRSDPVDVIQSLNQIGSTYAIGRDVHVGDTIIGIKGRVGFEAPAATMLIKAHHLLEKHVLTKHQLLVKDQLAQWYGSMMHEGNYLDPAMRDIEAFFESSQEHVTGDVKLLLSPYRFQVLGISSEYDLMQVEFGQYGEINKAWTGQDARGFATIYANQTKLYHTIRSK